MCAKPRGSGSPAFPGKRGCGHLARNVQDIQLADESISVIGRASDMAPTGLIQENER
jgi:hypothetical protein